MTTITIQQRTHSNLKCCVLRHLVMIFVLVSSRWIPTTSMTTWMTTEIVNSSLNSLTEVLVIQSSNSSGKFDSTVTSPPDITTGRDNAELTTSAWFQLAPATSILPSTTTDIVTTNSIAVSTTTSSVTTNGGNVEMSTSATPRLVLTTSVIPETSTNMATTTTTMQANSVTGIHNDISTTVSRTTTTEVSNLSRLTSHSMISSTLLSLSSRTDVTRSTATPITSGVNHTTSETLGVSASSVTSAYNNMANSSDIGITYSTTMWSSEMPMITSTPSIANNKILGTELTTLEFGLAVGLGAGGGFLLIILFIIGVSCVVKRKQKRKRDTMSEQMNSRTYENTKRKQSKNKHKKRAASSPTVGVDNVRLTPVSFGKSPVQKLVEKNKNAKIRRSKRGSVQELTQAFAESNDSEQSQQQQPQPQMQTFSEQATIGIPSDAVTIVSETGNPSAGTNGLNNNNNDDSKTSRNANELQTSEHKPKRPGPSVKARPQAGSGLHLQASPPRGVTKQTMSSVSEASNSASTVYSQASLLSVPSITSSPSAVEQLDDDEPFPPPPIVGYVNPYSEQFDPPLHNQPQQREQRKELPNRKILLTQNSFGESHTDVDAQHNPLFGLSQMTK